MTDSNKTPDKDYEDRIPPMEIVTHGIGMMLTTCSTLVMAYGIGQDKHSWTMLGLGMLYVGHRYIDRVEEAKRHRELISAIKSLENKVTNS